MNDKMFGKEELIGLHVTIKECKDPNWINRSGLIIDETKKTFLIEINGQEKMIAKKAATFEFDYDGEKITIDGSKIVYRPENRIKKVR
jgi:ribonuclease P protein subunit POP4